MEHDINFLSSEDLDLANLTDEELIATWNAWLEAAQSTNDLDEGYFSHACFGYYVPNEQD